MGTDVQCRSYLTGYYSMGNLNEDTNSSWSYEDRTLNGHFYNGFMLNGYSEYDKEMLKRTMLEHDAVFRKQVYELHRLYRIQKDLMDELKEKESNRFTLAISTSQSTLSASKMSSAVSENAWQMSHLTTGTTSYHGASAAKSNETRPPSVTLKETSTQSSSIPSMNGSSLKDEELRDLKLTKLPRKKFDLQLPADVYIDNEDEERAEKENVISPSFRKGICISDSHPKNDLSAHRLADLNEPIEDIHEGEVGPAATQVLSVRTHHEEMQGHQLPGNPNATYRDFFADMHENEGTCSKNSDVDKEETRQQWPLFHNEIGQSRREVKSFHQGLYRESLPMSSKSMQLMHTSPGIVLPDQKKTDTWFREKPSNGTEISGRNRHLASSTYSGLTVPRPPSPFSGVHHSKNSCTTNSPVSSWRNSVKPTTHAPIEFQALSSFNGSHSMNGQNKSSYEGIPNFNNAFGGWPFNGSFRSNATSGSEISSSLKGFHHGFPSNSNSSMYPQLPPPTFCLPNSNHSNKSVCGNSKGHEKYLQYANVKPALDVGLNQALTNGSRDRLTVHEDAERNCEELSGKLSCLGTKLVCKRSDDVKKHISEMESGFSRGFSQMMRSCDTADPEINKKQDKGKGPALLALQDFPASLKFKESTYQKDEVSDSLNGKRMISFPILDKVQQNDLSSSSKNDTRCSWKHGLLPDLSFDVRVPSSEKQVHGVGLVTGKDVGNSKKGFRNHINLNSAVSYMNIPKSSKNSPEDEAEIPSPLSVPCVAGKIARDIDLEAPVVAQAEENINLQEEVIGLNQLAAPIQMPFSKINGWQETKCSYQTFAKMAAVNLISMSLDMHSCSDNLIRPVTPASCDPLHWFADFVSSNADSASVSKEGGPSSAESSDDDGSDHFESMTLKLKALKRDEYWPREVENLKDEGTGTASLLLTKPRKVRAKKRRQRRDFQKDILPGLASLSRHEVTTDLQALGVLITKSGRSSKASLARQNTSQNEFPSQARGRGRKRSLAIAAPEVCVHPSPTQPTLTEPEPEGNSVVGWGRTRRCRRPRVPSGNTSALLT